MLALFLICLLYVVVFFVAFVYFEDFMIANVPDVLLGISLLITVFLLVGTSVFLVLRHFFFPANTAIVYESGLLLSRSSKTITQPFHGIKEMEFVPLDWASPTYKMNTVTLIRKDGSKPIVARVPDFKNFSKALRSAFMQYKERSDK